MRLKLGKLTYDKRTEVGMVEIDWESMPNGVVLLDVLKDWIFDLSEIYERKHGEVFKQGETK